MVLWGENMLGSKEAEASEDCRVDLWQCAQGKLKTPWLLQELGDLRE